MGFTLKSCSLNEIILNAEDYLIEHTDAIQSECEIQQTNRQQYLTWSDGKGYTFELWGEIVDFSDHWHKAPETRIELARVVDSEGQVVKLYYRVGETEHNAPTGYTYSHKENKHIPIEE